MKAVPSPLTGTLHQVRFECISLDVAADGVEVVVILNGKGFERDRRGQGQYCDGGRATVESV